jgi:mannose-P-dolichol utilization defect 1
MEIKSLKIPRLLLNLSEKLIGSACTSQLFESFEIYPLTTSNPDCTKLFIRKGLNLGIIGGSSLVKSPQLFKILLNQSVAGLNMIGQVLELVASTIAFAYNFRAGNPFLVYGETVFVSIQNALLVLLIGFYGNKMIQLLFYTAFYSVLLSTLLIPSYVTDEQMAILQAATIPISALARLPQIFQVWSSDSAGQLSSISLFLTMAGSLARLYTSSAEVKDPILLIGYSSTALLNTILFLQVIFASNKKSVEKKKKKD